MAKAQGKMCAAQSIDLTGTHKILPRTSTLMNLVDYVQLVILDWNFLDGMSNCPPKQKGLRFSCSINTPSRGTCSLRITCPRSGFPLGSVVYKCLAVL